MKNGWRNTAGALLGLAASALAATTQYKFSPAGNYPGASETLPLAVKGKHIGGFYHSGNVVSGYLQTGTKFVQINPPGALTSYISAINRSTMLVGGSCPNYCNSNTGQHGFLYSQGKYTQIDYPSGQQGTTTTAFGINDQGQIVGGYCLAPRGSCPSDYVNPANHGFLDDHGVFTQLDYPGAQLTQANAINNAGVIAGTYAANLTGPHAFLYQNGVYTNIDVPGATATFVGSINNLGVAAGSYQDRNSYVHGFLYHNGRFTTVDMPGATVTNLDANDDAGVLVGFWYTATKGGTFKAVPLVNSAAGADIPSPR